MTTSSFTAQFRCINDACGKTYPLTQVVYRCEACGNLLEVDHNRDAWRAARSGTEWKMLFESRWLRHDWPYGSGVWGKKEWVLPFVDNDNVVSMFEGGSNLFWADRLGKQMGLDELWIKLCGNSHTGSFKDLGMTVLVSAVKELKARGVDIPAVACASTGDTSAALAAYAAAAGIPAIVILPANKISLAQLVQPLANGATVLSLDGDFDDCMRIVQEVTQEMNLYLANSMNSLRIEGQKTVGLEIIQQFDWQVPDWIIIPGGNLGNVSALAKGLLDLESVGLLPRRPRIVCAQAANASPLYESFKANWAELKPVTAQKTLASAIQIGNPVSFPKAVKALKEFNGLVEIATEQELADAAAEADRTGAFTCPHTGVALAATKKLVANGTIRKNQRVVVVSTANGLKFNEFKVGYHSRELAGVQPQWSNQPVQLPATSKAVIGELSRRFAK